MNIKDFLIDNYIYIIIVIVLIIITIIGFLADKKKSDNKKAAPANQTPNASTEPLPMNMPPQQAMNYQPTGTVNPVNNQINNNQLNSGLGQIPLNNNTTMQQPLGQVPNNQPFFTSTPKPNPVNTNQSINNQGTVPSDTNNMFGINQNASMPQNNTYPMPNPMPNNNLNNQMIAPLPTSPMQNASPQPISMAQTTPNNQTPNQNGFSNSATMPQPVNQMPVSFVYGQNTNQNNNNQSI